MDRELKENLASVVGGSAASGSAAESAEECRAWAESLTDSMAVLLQVAEELNSTLELDEVLRRVAERVKEQVGYDTFGVLLLDPLGQELHIHFGIGYPPEVAKHWRFGLGQGIVGTAAMTGQPVRVDDVSREPRYIDAGEGIVSEMAIPLIVKNRTIGVLDVGSRQANYFTPAHQRLLTLLAGRLSTAIENARLYENLQQQTRTLSLLHEVSRELTSILERDALLRKVAQLVKRLVNYQGFHVMLWNEQTQILESTFSLRYDQRISVKGGLPLGAGICGTAGALRQPVRVPNVHLDPRYLSCGDAVEVKSELVVPLVFKDRLVGVIDLESTEYNAFTEHHEQMLSTLASYIAVALENARLYEKVRVDEKRLETDMATAREIQRGLLPDAAPRVPGLEVAFAYCSARILGGDVYDFLPYPEGRLAIAVGDVSGKGAAAALYGSLAIGILRAHVVEHPCDPQQMMVELNQHLQQPRVNNRYVALAFGVYDSRSKIFTVANAGFPRPCLVRGGRVEEIDVVGVPLGLLPGMRYEEKKLALHGGDMIIFCSDGIHEVMEDGPNDSGRARLHGIVTDLTAQGLSPAELTQAIVRASDPFATRAGDHADDRTVVVLRATTD